MNKMNQQERKTTANSALTRFKKEIMGERPTRKRVSAGMYNDNPISLLEWLGMLLLMAIAVVTGYKMVAIAFPFAASFYDAATPQWIVSSFGVAMSAVFILFSTSGLVYYTLMDVYDPSIEREKKKHNRLEFKLWVFPVNLLQYISPRLYGLLTYLTVAWLLFVSSAGDGSVFDKYLIVVAEVALAHLVSNLIEKRRVWRTTVSTAYTTKVDKYDARLAGYSTNRDYRTILFQELRNTLTHLVRKIDNKKRKPNLGMDDLPSNEVYNIVMEEYRRMTEGERFADALDGAKSIVVELRKPPPGDQYWIAKSLHQDFIIAGKHPSDDYTENDLPSEYENGYQARTAFRDNTQRDGAKRFFTQYQ